MNIKSIQNSDSLWVSELSRAPHLLRRPLDDTPAAARECMECFRPPPPLCRPPGRHELVQYGGSDGVVGSADGAVGTGVGYAGADLDSPVHATRRQCLRMAGFASLGYFVPRCCRGL